MSREKTIRYLMKKEQNLSLKKTFLVRQNRLTLILLQPPGEQALS